MSETLEALAQLSVLVFVIGSMMSMGLSLTMSQIIEPLVDTVSLADLRQRLRIGVTDGHRAHTGMMQIDRHKLRTEAEPYQNNIDPIIRHECASVWSGFLPQRTLRTAEELL